MQNTSEPAEETDPDDSSEEAANEKRHVIALIDETLHDRANKFLEKNNDVCKNVDIH